MTSINETMDCRHKDLIHILYFKAVVFWMVFHNYEETKTILKLLLEKIHQQKKKMKADQDVDLTKLEVDEFLYIVNGQNLLDVEVEKLCKEWKNKNPEKNYEKIEEYLKGSISWGISNWPVAQRIFWSSKIISQ